MSGRDISCTRGLRSGRFVTGGMLVAEAAYRRLTTPRGKLRGREEEANYGLDLMSLVGRTDVRALEAALPGMITGELKKDERIVDVDVRVIAETRGPSTSFVVTVEAFTSEGPFSLELGVSEVSIELLGLGGSS